MITLANAEEFGQSGVKFKCTHFSNQKKMASFKEQRIYHQKKSGGGEKGAEYIPC